MDMSRNKIVSFGLAAVGAVTVGLVAGILAFSVASAASGKLTIGSATVAPGGQGLVNLEVEDVTAPGLGAWTIDIAYDSTAVAAIACNPQQGVCNADYAAETVRFTGAVANGLVGDTTLGSITFQCAESTGSSVLTVSPQVFADATLGRPQDIDATVQNGSIACVDVPPTVPPVPTSTPGEPAPTDTAAPAATSTPTGKGFPVSGTGGPGSDGGSTVGWLMAGLAGAGIAWLIAGMAGGGLAIASRSRAPALAATESRAGTSSPAAGESTARPSWLKLSPPPALVRPDTFKPRRRSE
jgi:hypothetical protein